MISTFVEIVEKKAYFEPTVEIVEFNTDEDVICNSQITNESNDNEFGAGDLNGFLD